MSKFSVIYGVSRPAINERVSIGLLFFNSNQSYFDYSKEKISILGRLVSKQELTSVRSFLNNVKSRIDIHCDNDNSNIELINSPKKEVNFINEGFIQYLSNYHTNIIAVSPPQKTSFLLNESNFKELFKKFVDKKYNTGIEVSYSIPNRIEIVKNSYYPTLTPYFNLNEKITNKDFPTLIMPLNFDLVGKNENTVFVKSIDLEKKLNLIKSDISSLYMVKDAEPKSKRFIVSYEPSKKKTESHAMWKNIRKNKSFDLVDVSEKERIKEYAVQHEVLPLH